MKEQQDALQALLEAIRNNVAKRLVGKDEALEHLLIALIASGHVLIEDVPGIGKTSLVRSLAESLELSFQRIQFTPDVLPSDITGFNMYNPKTREFEYVQGVLMTHLLLADEINRTSPKTQSSLLEAMQERQVSVDGVTYDLPRPFMVMATQNPLDHLGTYPLPEAQLDRFMMRIPMGYPEIEEEMDILRLHGDQTLEDPLHAVVSREDILYLQKKVLQIYISEPLLRYIVELSQQTRARKEFVLGVSPRATLMLQRAAQARALLRGRDFLLPDDIQALFLPCFSHRLRLSSTGAHDQEIDQILLDLLEKQRVPK
jgi:MoxR-like ATPase